MTKAAIIIQDIADRQYDLSLAIKQLAANLLSLDAKADSMDITFKGMARDLQKLKENAYADFSTMNARFDRLEDRVDRLEALLDGSTYQH